MTKGVSSMSPVFNHDCDSVVGSAGDYSTVLVEGTLVSFGIAASQASGGATTAPSFIGDRRFSCTTGGAGNCDNAVIAVAGGLQERLSETELRVTAAATPVGN